MADEQMAFPEASDDAQQSARNLAAMRVRLPIDGRPVAYRVDELTAGFVRGLADDLAGLPAAARGAAVFEALAAVIRPLADATAVAQEVLALAARVDAARHFLTVAGTVRVESGRGGAGPATESELEELGAKVEREIQARGGSRPTSRWIAEVVRMCGCPPPWPPFP